MEDNEILALMEEGLKNVGDTLGNQIAELNETAKRILVKPEDILTGAEVAAEEKATMEAGGALGAITNFEIWDIPIGGALAGGFTAIFASEIIDGFLMAQADWMKGVVKLVAAGAAIKWSGRVLGSTGSKALGILLAYDGIRSLIPIDTWAKKGADTVTGMIPGGGLGGFKKNVREERTNSPVDYYAGLTGGGR